MSLAYVVAWLTPLLLGSGIVALLQGRPKTAANCLQTLGCGFVLGALLCTVAMAPLGGIATSRIVPLLAPFLVAIGAGAWAWAWLWTDRDSAPSHRGEGRFRLLAWVLVALLVVHAALMADEILLRPMYPWDAWAAWLLKPKAWMLSGHLDRFAPFDEWLADASGTLRTAHTWNYPEALGRIALWFSSAWGEWNAAVVGMSWFALWMALLIGVYGQLRALGLKRERAVIAIYALGSLPLINVHVALAGYADLWIATLLAFACLAWMRGVETGARGPLVLAVLFAAMLPFVKLEGSVWLVIFGASMLYASMPRQLRRWALALAPVIGAATIAAYLLRWPPIAPVLDKIGLSADAEAILEHAPMVVGAAAQGLFSQYNWHLFWLAAALTLLVRATQLTRSPSLRVLGLFMLVGCAFLFALFVLTPAGRWAETYTAVNRLSLQIVPSMLVFCALLWREPEPAVARANPPPRMAQVAATAP